MNTFNEPMNNTTRVLIATIRDELDDYEKRVKQMEQDVFEREPHFKRGVSFRVVK